MADSTNTNNTGNGNPAQVQIHAPFFPDQVPDVDEIGRGFALGKEGNLFDAIGRVHWIASFPIVEFVEPNPGEGDSFEMAEQADIEDAENRQDEPPSVGDQAAGWWLMDGIIKQGVGRVVFVFNDVERPWVEEFLEYDEEKRAHIVTERLMKEGKDWEGELPEDYGLDSTNGTKPALQFR